MRILRVTYFTNFFTLKVDHFNIERVFGQYYNLGDSESRTKYNGCFFKFGVEVDVEESIVKAPPDCNSDQLFKSNLIFSVFLICKNLSFLRRVVHQLFESNLTFCVVSVFNLRFEKSVFLTS
jgi:hypothetical protein